jgi:hypothetical protein
MEPSRFWSLYAKAFRRPGPALRRVAADPRSVRLGAAAVAITATVYTIVYFFLAHNGGRPTVFSPWLAIPAEDYYRYNQWMLVPSIALAWVAASGFAQFTARSFGGRGSFEQTLGVLGFGISVSSWWTGLHDLLTSFLGFVDVIDQRAYEDAMNGPTLARTLLWTLMLGYLIWSWMMFTKGVMAAHRLSVPRSLTAGFVGFLVYQLVFIVFNR